MYWVKHWQPVTRFGFSADAPTRLPLTAESRRSLETFSTLRQYLARFRARMP